MQDMSIFMEPSIDRWDMKAETASFNLSIKKMDSPPLITQRTDLNKNLNRLDMEPKWTRNIISTQRIIKGAVAA